MAELLILSLQESPAIRQRELILATWFRQQQCTYIAYENTNKRKMVIVMSTMATGSDAAPEPYR